MVASDMSPKNPWTVEKWHVRSALRAAGVNLPEAAITLPEEPIVGPDNVSAHSAFYICQADSSFILSSAVNRKKIIVII